MEPEMEHHIGISRSQRKTLTIGDHPCRASCFFPVDCIGDSIEWCCNVLHALRLKANHAALQMQMDAGGILSMLNTSKQSLIAFLNLRALRGS